MISWSMAWLSMQQGASWPPPTRRAKVRVWSVERDDSKCLFQLRAPSRVHLALNFDASGRRLAAVAGFVWDLAAPTVYAPLRLRRMSSGWGVSFHPSGNWIATAEGDDTKLWPISRPFPKVIGRLEGALGGLAFSRTEAISSRLRKMEPFAPGLFQTVPRVQRRNLARKKRGICMAGLSRNGSWWAIRSGLEPFRRSHHRASGRKLVQNLDRRLYRYGVVCGGRRHGSFRRGG